MASPMVLTVEAAGTTDVGIGRASNEDSFGFDIGKGIFVVCDGMGGMAAGEVASAIAVKTILDYFRDWTIQHTLPSEPGCDGAAGSSEPLAAALRLANQSIFQEGLHKPEYSGMGATVAAVRFAKDAFLVGHVGDSRVYLIRDQAICRLTKDHTVVAEQVRLGLLSLEEAAVSRMQNLVTRALGARDRVEPDFSRHSASPRDVLLLCTDGLSRYVADENLLAIISRTEELQHACDSLVQKAKDSGSNDNITCVLVRVEQG